MLCSFFTMTDVRAYDLACDKDVSTIKIPTSAISIGSLQTLQFYYDEDQKDRVTIDRVYGSKPAGYVEPSKTNLLDSYNVDKMLKDLTVTPETTLEQVYENDNRRELSVIKMLQKQSIRSADELYHSGFIFQHANCNALIKLANTLAYAAIQRGSQKAKWLYAASLDRYLVNQGKPQKYGTQSLLQDGRAVLAPVESTTTDADRAMYNVRPLAQILEDPSASSMLKKGADSH